MAKSVGRLALGMGAVTLVSRVTGLIRSTLLAAFFGASSLGDAFLIAFRFPNLLRRLFGEGAMSAGFVPVFTELLAKGDGGAAARRYFARILTFLSVVLAALTLLCMVFAPLVIDFYYMGQGAPPPGQKETATLLFRLMFPYLFFVSLAAILQGVLNSHDEFALPAATPVLLNLSMIAGAGVFWVLASRGLAQDEVWKAYALSGGVLLGGFLQFAAQIGAVRRRGYLLVFDWKPRDPELRRFLMLMLPTVFSAGIYQLNSVLVDPFAIALGEGAVSALYYSARLQELPLGIVVVSLATVSLPAFARHRAAGDRKALSNEIARALGLTSLVMLPVTLYSFFFGSDIIALLYGYGRFDAKAAELTRACFLWHIASIFAVGWARILTNAFFAEQDTRTPLLISALGLVVNVALAWALTRPLGFGVGGIALAGGLSSLAMAGAYAFLLAKRKIASLGATFLLDHGKFLLALVPTGLALWACHRALPPLWTSIAAKGFWGEKVSLALTIGASALVLGAVWVTLLWVLRVDGVRVLAGRVGVRLSRKA